MKLLTYAVNKLQEDSFKSYSLIAFNTISSHEYFVYHFATCDI